MTKHQTGTRKEWLAARLSSPPFGLHTGDEASGLSRRGCNRGLAARCQTRSLLCTGSPIAGQILFRGPVARPFAMGRLAGDKQQRHRQGHRAHPRPPRTSVLSRVKHDRSPPDPKATSAWARRAGGD